MGAAAVPTTEVVRVRHVAGGLVDVVTGHGAVQAGLGGAMLARVAADSGAMPRRGDRVVLTWWPDGPATVERVLPLRAC